MADDIQPRPAPDLHLPQSSETCDISIINTTCDLTLPYDTLLEPHIRGHEWLNLPTYSFHLQHKGSGKQILFDIGCRKDWWNMPPSVTVLLENKIPGMNVEKDILDILGQDGVDINDIDALVLGHWHFDHCGDPSSLPLSVDMIVGPGFKKAFLPGYPTVDASPFHESAFVGRVITEISFSDTFQIGGFQAHDYFGDGSFYLLNVPGHALGHICGLVRTTPSTFIFLGGDVCHYGGAFRPTPYIPLPSTLPRETKLTNRRLPNPCPCSVFTACHPFADGDEHTARTSHFYQASSVSRSWFVDSTTAQKSINRLEEFDAHPDILVAIAHDPAALDAWTFFPNGTMNEWQTQGWKLACHWGWLNELPFKGQPGREGFLVDGLYKDGIKVKELDGTPV